MTPPARLRASKQTPSNWTHVILVQIRPGTPGLISCYSVRHAITFNRIDAGLRRLAKLGATATEETSLKEALLAGAVLEEWLRENRNKK